MITENEPQVVVITENEPQVVVITENEPHVVVITENEPLVVAIFHSCDIVTYRAGAFAQLIMTFKTEVLGGFDKCNT